MPEKNSTSWSADQADKLQHEAFVAEVQRLRAGFQNRDGPKRWWQTFLETKGGTALITVVLGGLVGTVITGLIQSRIKEREFEQAWLKARGDQALVAYKDYLEQQRETVKRVYELIGGSISASEDLIEITGPHFDPEEYPGVEQQRQRLKENYNSQDRRWRDEHEMLGLLITYYHHGQPTVIGSWNETKDSVTKFMECAADWFEKHKEPTKTSGACKVERENVSAKLASLGESLDKARRFAWEGWDSPESLRGH